MTHDSKAKSYHNIAVSLVITVCIFTALIVGVGLITNRCSAKCKRKQMQDVEQNGDHIYEEIPDELALSSEIHVEKNNAYGQFKSKY